eukprot:750464-Hanusia_phi.AAC.1
MPQSTPLIHPRTMAYALTILSTFVSSMGAFHLTPASDPTYATSLAAAARRVPPPPSSSPS